MDKKFWLQQKPWPRDPAGFVFLARAVHTLGQRLFGDDWTTLEPIQTLPGPRKEIPAIPATLDHRGAPARTRPGIEDLPSEQVARTKAAIHRFIAVKEVFIRNFESGNLDSYYRDRKGGAMKHCPREWWNTEYSFWRFVLCRIFPSEPYHYAIAGDGDAYLFVETKGFERLIASLKDKTKQTAAAERLCQDWLIEEMSASPNKKPKIKGRFRDEAKDKFKVGSNQFERAWQNALLNTGANWNKAGAPTKS